MSKSDLIGADENSRLSIFSIGRSSTPKENINKFALGTRLKNLDSYQPSWTNTAANNKEQQPLEAVFQRYMSDLCTFVVREHEFASGFFVHPLAVGQSESEKAVCTILETAFDLSSKLSKVCHSADCGFYTNKRMLSVLYVLHSVLASLPDLDRTVL